MSDYRFALYDINNAAKLIDLRVIAARVIEALSGEHTMSLEINPFDPGGVQYLGLLGDSATAIIHAQKFIRVTSSLNSDTDYFIVRGVTKQRAKDGSLLISADCEHLKYQLLNKVVRTQQAYTQINATEYLNIIMAGISDFTIAENDIPTTIYRDIEINYPTVMAALKNLCDTFTEFDGTYERKFYYTCDYLGNIRIKREDALGSLSPYPLILNHNFVDVQDKRDDSTLANRLYYSGNGNTIGFADSVPIVDSSDSTVKVTAALLVFSSVNDIFTLNDNGANTNPVAWESIISIRMNSIAAGGWGSGSGSFIVTANIELLGTADAVVFSSQVSFGEVTYPNRSTGNPKWFHFLVGQGQTVYKIKYTTTAIQFLNGANPQGVGVQKVDLQYELGPNVDYVEDVSAQAIYGVVEASLQNRDVPKVINVLRNWKTQGGALLSFDSTLSTGYTSGLNAMFRKITTGLPPGANVTASENSNRSYIVNGTRSQKIFTQFKDNGIGLSTAFPWLCEGWSYQFIMVLHITSGNLAIRVTEGYPYTGVETELFKIETAAYGWSIIGTQTGFGITSGSGAKQFDITIKTISEGATFYVDSLCLARTDEPIDFYKDNSANVLKDKAQRILRLNARPRTSYQVTAKDLAQIDDYYKAASLNVGDDVLLKDNVAELSTQQKIFRKESDLFNPKATRLTLGDRTVGAAEMIATLSGEKNLRGI